MTKETIRINLNLTKDLVSLCDDYADRMNLNRTAAISVLLSMALESQKNMATLSELLELLQNQEAPKN